MDMASRDALQQARIDLAALHRLAHAYQWNESVVNHMTFMVPGRSDQYLIIPYGLHWNEVKASDFMIVDMAGKVVAGSGEPETSAIALHGPLHRRLAQARCVLHTHQPNLSGLAALRDQRLLMVHQDATMFHGIVAYIDTYGDLPLDDTAGEVVAAAMGEALVLMMANHGPMVVGHTVAQTFQTLYYLDRIAAVQLKALSTGREVQVIGDDLAARIGPIVRSVYLGREAQLHFDAQKRLLDRQGSDYAG